MELGQFEEIMEMYFDVRCDIVHEFKTIPALVERAKRNWIYGKPITVSSSTITFSGSCFGTPGSKREVCVKCDVLSPRVIKRILASFGVPEAAFIEACNCEGCYPN